MDGILLRRTRDFFLYAVAEHERFEEGSVKLRVQRLEDPASPGCMDCECNLGLTLPTKLASIRKIE